MPKLRKDREIIELPLASAEGGSVALYKELLAADMDRIQRDNPTGAFGVTQLLALFIKSWNLEDEDGSPLPVTPENVGKLTSTDVGSIMLALGYKKDDTGGFLPEKPEK